MNNNIADTEKGTARQILQDHMGGNIDWIPVLEQVIDAMEDYAKQKVEEYRSMQGSEAPLSKAKAYLEAAIYIKPEVVVRELRKLLSIEADSSNAADNQKGKQGSEWISVEDVNLEYFLSRSQLGSIRMFSIDTNVNKPEIEAVRLIEKDCFEEMNLYSVKLKDGRQRIYLGTETPNSDKNVQGCDTTEGEGRTVAGYRAFIQEIYESTTDGKVREMIENFKN